MEKSLMAWSDEFRKIVDKEISRVIPNATYPPNLYQPIWHHLKSGGKRFRSTCAILICKSFNKDIKKVMPFAAACEVLHNWLLIHDDIEDGDLFRREVPTVWAKYGINTAINVGDFLSEKVYEMVLRLKDKKVSNEIIMTLLKLTVDTTLKTIEGQALDMHFRGILPKESEYMKMVNLKTGAYLALPMIGAAIIAGADSKSVQSIKKYGEFIGPAYQIMDDISDYDKRSKNFGSDIKEGKKTLMIIHCASKCGNAEKRKLIKILNKQREKTTLQDIKYVEDLLERHKSIDYSFNKANFLIERGKESIKEIRNPTAKGYFNEIANFIINRSF